MMMGVDPPVPLVVMNAAATDGAATRRIRDKNKTILALSFLGAALIPGALVLK